MKNQRVYKFLARHTKKSKPWRFDEAPDPRQKGKVTHPMAHVYNALWLGLMSNSPTLRDVEELINELGTWASAMVPEPISDTTLDTEARRLDELYLHRALVAQVRDMHRSKMLSPVGLPCGVATVDGKNLATLTHDAGGRAQPRSTENEKWHPKAGASGKGEQVVSWRALSPPWRR